MVWEDLKMAREWERFQLMCDNWYLVLPPKVYAFLLKYPTKLYAFFLKRELSAQFES